MLGKATIFLLLLPAHALFAQTRATTADGKAVLLYSDGTWKYASSVKASLSGSATRSPTATEKVDLWRGKGSVYYDPAKWRIKKSEPGRAEFEHADGDLYAVVIQERAAIPLEALRKLALNNVLNIAPDAKIAQERTVRVNGIDVLELRINATVSGFAVVYLGHYYSGDQGIVQVLTYTAANLYDEFQADAHEFLNGLAIGN